MPADYPALWCSRQQSSEVLLAVKPNLRTLLHVTAVTEWDLARHLLLVEWLDVMEMVQRGVSHIFEKPVLWLWGSITLQTPQGKGNCPSKMLLLKCNVFLRASVYRVAM